MDKIEYRVWNPFRSKLAAAILGGIDNIHIKPGSKVLYLGAASGTTVSHVSDVVGPVSVIAELVLSCCLSYLILPICFLPIWNVFLVSTSGGQGICSGILTQIGKRSDQCCKEKNQCRTYNRGCQTSPQVQTSCWYDASLHCCHCFFFSSVNLTLSRSWD